MMMCLLWRYDCTILMTCNDKSDVLYFLMSSFCQRSVYSLSCWACVFLPVTLFATPSGGERLYPYLFTCHVSTGHLFLLAISMILCVLLVFGPAGGLVVFFLGFLSIRLIFAVSLISLSLLLSIGLDSFSCFCCLVGFDTPQAVWPRSQLSTVYASLGGFQRVAFVDLI